MELGSERGTRHSATATNSSSYSSNAGPCVSADGSFIRFSRSFSDGKPTVRPAPHPQGVRAVAASGDGSTFASAGPSGDVVLWKYRSFLWPRKSGSLQTGLAALDVMALDAGATRLFVLGDGDSRIEVWDLDSRSVLEILALDDYPSDLYRLEVTVAADGRIEDAVRTRAEPAWVPPEEPSYLPGVDLGDRSTCASGSLDHCRLIDRVTGWELGACWGSFPHRQGEGITHRSRPGPVYEVCASDDTFIVWRRCSESPCETEQVGDVLLAR